MKYRLNYTNKKGEEITTITHGDDAEHACQRYGNRPVFGGSQIFQGGQRVVNCDAETCGTKWAEINVDKFDGTGETFRVSVEQIV